MSEKVYGWLLRLYPKQFRNEYSSAMRQLFRDRMMAERGMLGRLRLWLDILHDLGVSIPLEHQRHPSVTLASSSSGVHALSEESIRRMAKRGHNLSGVLVLSIGFGLLLGWYGDAPRWPLLGAYSLFALLIPVFFLASRRRSHHWRGYQIVLENDRIIVKQDGAVTLSLLRGDIVGLLETKGLGLAIQSKKPRKGIWVPSVLTGYDELRQRLSDWAAIDERPGPGGFAGLLHPFLGTAWILSIYLPALLVRSPSFVLALSVVAGTFLAFLAGKALKDGAGWPVMLIRLAMIALLVNKIVSTVFGEA
jgi:hypothetical protein